MSFFDRKQEVLDIQLTQYGKRMLAAGQFKPEHYAFFDNDILYDLKYASVPSNADDIYENQNEIEPRIEETPRLKTQYVFDGIQTSFTETTKHLRDSFRLLSLNCPQTEEFESNLMFRVEDAFRDKFTSLYSQYFALGTHDGLKKYVPAWQVSYAYGKLEELSQSVDGIAQLVSIPQLNSEVTYKTYVTKYNAGGKLIDDYVKTLGAEEFSGDDSFDGSVHDLEFKDDTTIQVQEDYLLVGVTEKNIELLRENFDIEVFMTSSESDGLERLYFHNPMSDVDIMERHVEYYFDVFVDNEIEDRYLFDVPSEIRKTGDVFIDSHEQEYDNISEQPVVFDIYGKISSTEEELDEPC